MILTHIYGAANKVADALSRLAAPQEALLPPEVFAGKKRECPARDAGYYRLPPPRNKSKELHHEFIENEIDAQAFACPWSSRSEVPTKGRELLPAPGPKE